MMFCTCLRLMDDKGDYYQCPVCENITPKMDEGVDELYRCISLRRQEPTPMAKTEKALKMYSGWFLGMVMIVVLIIIIIMEYGG